MGYESGIATSCGTGRRQGLDPVLLWLWHRPAAVALIQPLAWELPYAAGTALKSQNGKKKKKKRIKENPEQECYLLNFLNAFKIPELKLYKKHSSHLKMKRCLFLFT